MKKNFNLKDKFKNFCFFVSLLLLLFFQSEFQIVEASTMENEKSGGVVEELRLEVPSEFREVWLSAEKRIWEPWLIRQDGFLGRQIYWDKEKEQALILVNWENKKLWKSISIKEVNEIQVKFENNVKTALNLKENPFILIYEGELTKQG